ncbi:acyl carrier protein [Kitasatospora sp. NPDC101183]|uniref:acyl carrier protein n=1 Tax=Kitasatospora sp. NPDC101183 TaxID=3364100 RepID=UPI0037F32D4A
MSADAFLGLLADTCHLDPDTLDAGTALSSLGLDSLALVELAERVYSDLGVDITDDELRSLDRVDAIGELIDARATADPD